MRASSLSTLLRVVRKGMGVTLVPEIALAEEVRPGGGLATRPLVDERGYRTIGLAWRKGSARAEEFQLLAEFLALSKRARKR